MFITSKGWYYCSITINNLEGCDMIVENDD